MCRSYVNGGGILYAQKATGTPWCAGCADGVMLYYAVLCCIMLFRCSQQAICRPRWCGMLWRRRMRCPRLLLQHPLRR